MASCDREDPHERLSMKPSFQRHPDGIVSTCPTTGLPVYARPGWRDVKLGANYFMSLSIVGDRILLGKIVGDSDLPSVVAALDFVKAVIREVFGERSFVYVEDFTELKHVTSDCKRYYMRFLESQKQMIALILCTSSPLIMMAIRISSRLKLIRYNGMVEKDVPSALKKAVQILASERPLKGVELDSIPRLNSEKSRCPVSGLSLVEKPGWCRMDLGGPSVTFHFIGNRILHTRFHDLTFFDKDLERRLMDKRERVLPALLSPSDPFVEIRDFRGVGWGAAFGLCRSTVLRNDRIIKHIAYNLPQPVQHLVKIKGTGPSRKQRILVRKNYEESLKEAILTLKSRGYTHEGTRDIVTRKEWGREFGDYSTVFEVIDANVIHRVSTGHLQESFIDGIFQLQKEVLESSGLAREPHYFIQGLTELEGIGLKARKAFFRKWAEFMQDQGCCRMTLMYGGNWSARAGLSISSPVRSLKIQLADTPEEAMERISLDKENRKSADREKPPLLPVETDRIKAYADELIYFLGNIHWEEDGFLPELAEKPPDHPFKAVYDALSLIKMDIDEVFRERELSRLALFNRDMNEAKKAEKHIQVLTQEIIKAQENERQRIARDLHDNVAQDLASLIITSDSLFEGCPDIPPEVREKAMDFSRILKKSIHAIRDLAYDLRPPSLDELGLVRTLARHCEEFSETSRIPVDFYSAGLEKLELDFDTEINLYRLIQEALNNVKKHSRANLVTIRLVASFPDIILRIEDNGRGFDLEERITEALHEKRMGLKSMEERVKLLKGEFTVRSREGEGTMILAKLPYGRPLDPQDSQRA